MVSLYVTTLLLLVYLTMLLDYTLKHKDYWKIILETMWKEDEAA
jgi:hypothetical protein